MALKTVDIRFYPLYKGEQSNRIEHRNVTKFKEKKNEVRITRNDNKTYVYPRKDIMRMVIS